PGHATPSSSSRARTSTASPASARQTRAATPTTTSNRVEDGPTGLMQLIARTDERSRMAAPNIQDPETLARGADALLRQHPDALVAALASNGLIVPVPQTVGMWGQTLIEGRAVFDNVVAEDRNT